MSLAGKHVAITRPRHQSQQMVQAIRAKGGIAHCFPLIETKPVRRPPQLDRILNRLDEYALLVFTSVNTVHYWMEQVRQRKDADVLLNQLQTMPCAAIGEKTRHALLEHHWPVVPLPTRFRQEELGQLIQRTVLPGNTVLYLRAENVRETLRDRLRASGYHVQELVLYQTLPDWEQGRSLVDRIRSMSLDAITFASPSAVHVFGQEWMNTPLTVDQRKLLLEKVVVSCIGPVTATATTQYELHVQVQPETYTGDALVEELINYYAS